VRVDNYWCHTTIFSRPTDRVDSSNIDSHRHGKGLMSPRGGQLHTQNSVLKASTCFGLKLPSPISEKIDAAAEGLHNLQQQASHAASSIHFPDVKRFHFKNPFHNDDKEKLVSPVHLSPLDMPGMSFVTVFSDDSKVGICVTLL